MKNNFEFSFIVLPEHLDALQHVNNVVYVQWMQDAASKHWGSLVSEELNEKILWVARRHEIDYLSQSFLNDELIMKTWIGNHTAVTSERHYEIVRKNDNRKIITAKSVWVLLDKKTFKPRRIDDEVLNVFK